MQQLSLADYLNVFKYRVNGILVHVRVFFETLTVEARIDGKWHVYELTPKAERLIIVDEDHNVQETTDPAAIERFLDTIARKVFE